MPQRYQTLVRRSEAHPGFARRSARSGCVARRIRRQRAKLPEAARAAVVSSEPEAARRTRLDKFPPWSAHRKRSHQRLCQPFEQRETATRRTTQGIALEDVARGFQSIHVVQSPRRGDAQRLHRRADEAFSASKSTEVPTFHVPRCVRGTRRQLFFNVVNTPREPAMCAINNPAAARGRSTSLPWRAHESPP